MESLVAKTPPVLHGRRVLVTGAAGFIGRRLVAALVEAEADVSVVDLPSTRFSQLQDSFSHLQFHVLDLRDKAAARDVVARSCPDYVFHLAAAGVTDPFLPLDLALAVNLNGAINLFRACFEVDSPPIRLVHTGTPYEYGGQSKREPYPISHYAASKAAAFVFARMFYRTRNWPIVTVRPFQVYGAGQPEQALIPAAGLAARSGRPFPMTGGEQKRDFIYIDDVVRGYLLAALNGVDGNSYDLGWGQAHSLRSVISRLYALMGVETRPIFGALPYRPGEIWDLRADTGAANQELGWKPSVDLAQGLEIMVRLFT